MKSTAVNTTSPAHLSLSSEFLCMRLFEQRQLLNILWEIPFNIWKEKKYLWTNWSTGLSCKCIDSVQCVAQKTLSLFTNVYVISEIWFESKVNKIITCFFDSRLDPYEITLWFDFIKMCVFFHHGKWIGCSGASYRMCIFSWKSIWSTFLLEKFPRVLFNATIFQNPLFTFNFQKLNNYSTPFISMSP